jgi:hypothetical protein
MLFSVALVFYQCITESQSERIVEREHTSHSVLVATSPLTPGASWEKHHWQSIQIDAPTGVAMTTLMTLEKLKSLQDPKLCHSIGAGQWLLMSQVQSASCPRSEESSPDHSDFPIFQKGQPATPVLDNK